MEYPYIINSKYLGFSSKIKLEEFILNNKDFIYKKIYEIGAILFRGFNLKDAKDFEDIVKRIDQTKFKKYVGGDSPRYKVSDNIYTSTSYPPESTISMHHEKSYSNIYPKFIYFFCDIPPSFGGETPIADSRKIYNLLNKNIIDKFAAKKIKYIMNLHNGIGFGKSWKEVFEVESKIELENLLDKLCITYSWKSNELLCVEEIVDPIIKHPITSEFVFFSQADQWHPSNLDDEILSIMRQIREEKDFYHNCTYRDNSEINLDDLNIIRQLVNKQRVIFQWQKGDLLMLDNIISMHGRLPFEGERRILVAMT